ncbi:hypothetical protein BS50DRAFT_301349 [Corynespora cassiicola Philippines]|uniref:Uncharacterized protein n=1 Tax=Corynespora cassiicola Philippines TaxID=1448308 RepID=A0A2T2NX07_CORCC|nr:hypothetical protein BS50DRAFT_301349 [Corynespora cassiicola Philippines]
MAQALGGRGDRGHTRPAGLETDMPCLLAHRNMGRIDCARAGSRERGRGARAWLLGRELRRGARGCRPQGQDGSLLCSSFEPLAAAPAPSRLLPPPLLRRPPLLANHQPAHYARPARGRRPLDVSTRPLRTASARPARGSCSLWHGRCELLASSSSRDPMVVSCTPKPLRQTRVRPPPTTTATTTATTQGTKNKNNRGASGPRVQL